MKANFNRAKWALIAAPLFSSAVAAPLPASPPAVSSSQENRNAAVDMRYWVQPSYPPYAVALGMQGNATLLVLIGSDGRPKDIKIEKSTGHRALDVLAINAAINWRFIPTLREGRPVDGYARIPVDFDPGADAIPPLTEAGHLSRALTDYVAQDGLLEEDFRMPFPTPQEVMTALASISTKYRFESEDHSRHVVMYRTLLEREPTVFEVFAKGSEFYPSVVHTRFVFETNHFEENHLEARRTILCGASSDACQALRHMLDEEDKICGTKVAIACKGRH